MKNSTLMFPDGLKLTNPIEWMSHSAEETLKIGYHIGKSLTPNAILCLFGDLGAGKTTLTKGIVEGITHLSPHEVSSPTFVYLTPYEGSTGLTVYHFDLYRLHDAEEFLKSGFEEYLYAGGICCIEWSERIASILPAHAIKVFLHHVERDIRRIIYDQTSV